MLKQLAGYLGKFKKQAILTPVLVAAEVLCETVIPLIMARLIDKGINGNAGNGDFRAIVLYGVALLIVCALGAVSGTYAGRVSATASAGFSMNLRRAMFHNVQTFSFANIDRFTTSSLVTRMTTDVTNVQNALVMILRMMVRSPITLIISLVVVLGISPKLGIVFLCVIPVLVVSLLIISKKVHPIFRKVFTYYDNLNSVVQENVRGVRVVKGFVREEYEKEKFNKVSRTIRDTFSGAERILALNGPIMSICMYACTIAVAWMGAHLIIESNEVLLTTGELQSVITYTASILMSLMMVSMMFVTLTMSRASGQRICEVLNEKADITNPEEPVMEVPDGSITFENVSFSYSGRRSALALDGINLDIKSGETIGILGGTGSSKTTLISLIPRLYDVTEGSIKVGGVDVRDYDMDTLRNQVAVVLQKNVLFSGSIAENLRWGDANASDEELVRICKLAQAHDFIMEMPEGYETYLDQGGTNLSGGQKQRLCIARAILKKPKILILDDSTSAVDTKTDALIRAAMREIIPGTTKLIIAQRVASVQDADRIIVLDKGRISGFGTHDELMETNEIYREVYETQSGGDFDE